MKTLHCCNLPFATFGSENKKITRNDRTGILVAVFRLTTGLSCSIGRKVFRVSIWQCLFTRTFGRLFVSQSALTVGCIYSCRMSSSGLRCTVMNRSQSLSKQGCHGTKGLSTHDVFDVISFVRWWFDSIFGSLATTSALTSTTFGCQGVDVRGNAVGSFGSLSSWL